MKLLIVSCGMLLSIFSGDLSWLCLWFPWLHNSCSLNSEISKEKSKPTVVDVVGKRSDPLILIYKYGKQRVLVLTNRYNTGKSYIEDPKLGIAELGRVLERHFLEAGQGRNKLSNIRVIGHADLEQMRVQSRDATGECMKRGFVSSGNACLALLRAINIMRVIESHAKDFVENISVSVDEDVFMAETNKSLDGTLYEMLGLDSKIKQIKVELGIPEEYESKQIRQDGRIQEEIARAPERYRSLFAPFRCVVVVVR